MMASTLRSRASFHDAYISRRPEDEFRHGPSLPSSIRRPEPDRARVQLEVPGDPIGVLPRLETVANEGRQEARAGGEPERATSDWPRHGRASQARDGHLYLPMSEGRHTRPVHGRRNCEGDSSVPARLLRRGLSSPRLRLRPNLVHVDFVNAHELRRDGHVDAAHQGVGFIPKIQVCGPTAPAEDRTGQSYLAPPVIPWWPPFLLSLPPAGSRPEIQVCGGPTAITNPVTYSDRTGQAFPVMPPWWPPFFRRSPSARRGFQSLPPADSRPEIQVCGPTAITNRDRTGQAFPKPWWPPFFRRSSPRVSARRRFQSLPPVGRTFFELLRGRLRLPTRWASVLISSQVAPRHVLGRFAPTRRAEGSPFSSRSTFRRAGVRPQATRNGPAPRPTCLCPAPLPTYLSTSARHPISASGFISRPLLLHWPLGPLPALFGRFRVHGLMSRGPRGPRGRFFSRSSFWVRRSRRQNLLLHARRTPFSPAHPTAARSAGGRCGWHRRAGPLFPIS